MERRPTSDYELQRRVMDAERYQRENGYGALRRVRHLRHWQAPLQLGLLSPIADYPEQRYQSNTEKQPSNKNGHPASVAYFPVTY